MRTSIFIVFFLAVSALASSATAQYFDPSPQRGDGYLPDTPRARSLDPTYMGPAPVPVLSLGGSAGLGVASLSLEPINEPYFVTYGGVSDEIITPLAFDLSGWIEIYQHFRIGLNYMSLVSDNGATDTFVNSGGLLLEAGGGSGLRFWVGTVIGAQRFVTVRDYVGGTDVEYGATDFHARFHAHAEVQLSRWVGIRGTPFIAVGARLDETYRGPGGIIVRAPDDRDDVGYVSGGVLLSVFVGPGY